MTQSKLEKLLIFIVFATAMLFVFVNISLLTTPAFQESTNHYSVTNVHMARSSQNFSAVIGSHDGSSRSSSKTKGQLPPTMDGNAHDAEDIYTVDEKLMRILRHVGITDPSQLSVEDRRLLPTWEQVAERVGDKGPRILGLDTCKVYRDKIPQGKRKLGVAGPFNSGTHYLNEVLSKNCIYKDSGQVSENKGVWDNVPWGKHQSPRFREVHNRNMGTSIGIKNDAIKEQNNGQMHHPELPPDLLEDNLSVLPVVMVRDPFTWWQSMCKTRYSAHWYHIAEIHCPNFIATDVERNWFFKTKQQIRQHYGPDPWKVDNVNEKANYTLDKKVIPLWVRYHSENWKHESLAHMWMDWYQDYYDAAFPRLMIRLEDLVFYPHETIRQICECGGGSIDANDGKGYFEYVGDENLELSLDSSIRTGKNLKTKEMVDKIHGKDRVGLLGAMAKHAGPFSDSHRANGMTKEDLKFATKVLKKSDVMSYFQYKVPDESHRVYPRATKKPSNSTR